MLHRLQCSVDPAAAYSRARPTRSQREAPRCRAPSRVLHGRRSLTNAGASVRTTVTQRCPSGEAPRSAPDGLRHGASRPERHSSQSDRRRARRIAPRMASAALGCLHQRRAAGSSVASHVRRPTQARECSQTRSVRWEESPSRVQPATNPVASKPAFHAMITGYGCGLMADGPARRTAVAELPLRRPRGPGRRHRALASLTAQRATSWRLPRRGRSGPGHCGRRLVARPEPAGGRP
jgi:hypothetical protein